MKTKEELQDLIDEKQSEVDEKQREIDNFEPSDVGDFEEQYDDMLDSCYPELFNMLPSRILSECDPIAYRCGLSDYVDSLEVSEMDEYKELETELEELESELSELEEEMEELDNEDL